MDSLQRYGLRSLMDGLQGAARSSSRDIRQEIRRAPGDSAGQEGELGATHSIVKLSNPDNSTTFKTIEIHSAVAKTVKMLAARAGLAEPDLSNSVITETGGGTGPFFPTLPDEVARMLVEHGVVTVSRISPDESDDDGEDDDDVDFMVTETRLAQHETDVQRQARWEKVMEKHSEKAERTVKLVIHLPKEASLLAPGGPRRIELTEVVKSRINDIVTPAEVRLNEQIDHVSEKRTNKLEAYIEFSSREEMEGARWDLLKYVEAYDGGFPYKVSMTRQAQEKTGVKPCCLMPQCDLRDGKCAAQAKAADHWRAGRRMRGSTDEMPPWKAQRVTREAESLHYRLQAEEDRACKRWKKGFCDKSAANCINRHDGRPSCKSARDSGWACKLDPCPYDSHVKRERE